MNMDIGGGIIDLMMYMLWILGAMVIVLLVGGFYEYCRGNLKIEFGKPRPPEHR